MMYPLRKAAMATGLTRGPLCTQIVFVEHVDNLFTFLNMKELRTRDEDMVEAYMHLAVRLNVDTDEFTDVFRS